MTPCTTAFPLALQVSDRAADDIGDPSADLIRPDEDLHCILREFKKRCSRGIEENSTPLRQVKKVIRNAKERAKSDPRRHTPLREADVYRIRCEGPDGAEYRAAVWLDTESNTIWLLRVLRISDFGGEDAETSLYEQMGAFHVGGVLLPSDHECASQSEDQFTHTVIRALVAAREQAESDPGEWKAAVMGLDGVDHVIGDAHVTVEAAPDGTYIETVVIVLNDDPPPFARAAAWRDDVQDVFVGDEAAVEDWSDLPDHRPSRQNFVPYRQVRIIDP